MCEIKKILIILPNLKAGGAEQVTLVLAKSLKESGFDPTIILFSKTGQFVNRIPEDISVIFPRSDRGKLLNLITGLFLAVREASTASVIIGALELSPTYIAFLAGLLTRKPVIGWVHIDLREYFKRIRIIHKFLMRAIYPKLDAIVSVSIGVSNSLKATIPKLKNHKLHVIYNINEFLCGSINCTNNNIIDIDISGKFIVSIGRLVEQKGFDLLISAHSEIIKDIQDLKLIILGEGPERKNLEMLSKSLGTSNLVLMPGFVNDVRPYIQNCWIMVHPARFEGLCMVLIEAMSYGKPVVSADCPSGPSEVLEGGLHGLLVKPNSVTDLLNAVLLLERDPDKYEYYGKAGNLRARDFSVEMIIPQWASIFKSLR